MKEQRKENHWPLRFKSQNPTLCPMSHLPKPFNVSDALEEEFEDDDDSDEEDDELSLITRKIKNVKKQEPLQV